MPITGDKLKTILDASNKSDVQLVYCNIVAKFLEGKDMPALLTQPQDTPSSGDVAKPDGDWDMVSDAQGDDDLIDVCETDSDDDALCTLFD
jgi:ribosomal protein L12E/L44/L45/RPP1/RPP2